jgi:hypothetical protein
MKTMTCKQLGGACEKTFHAETFDDMAAQSKAHGMEMLQQQDEAHMQAMKGMKELMASPAAMKDWMDQKKKDFDDLPEE